MPRTKKVSEVEVEEVTQQPPKKRGRRKKVEKVVELENKINEQNPVKEVEKVYQYLLITLVLFFPAFLYLLYF
jgi:hypothetical protein